MCEVSCEVVGCDGAGRALMSRPGGSWKGSCVDGTVAVGGAVIGSCEPDMGGMTEPELTSCCR